MISLKRYDFFLNPWLFSGRLCKKNKNNLKKWSIFVQKSLKNFKTLLKIYDSFQLSPTIFGEEVLDYTYISKILVTLWNVRHDKFKCNWQKHKPCEFIWKFFGSERVNNERTGKKLASCSCKKWVPLLLLGITVLALDLHPFPFPSISLLFSNSLWPQLYIWQRVNYCRFTGK